MSTSDEGYDYLPGQRSPRNRILDWIRNIAILTVIGYIMYAIYRNIPEYFDMMNYPLLIGITLVTIPLWSRIFDKFKLFVVSFSMDLTNTPIIGELKPSKNEISSQFMTHDGYPLHLLYKGVPITRTALQFVAGLAMATVFNKLDELVIENAQYQCYVTQLVTAATKESIDFADPNTVKNLLEAMEVKTDEILSKADKDVSNVPQPAVNES